MARDPDFARRRRARPPAAVRSQAAGSRRKAAPWSGLWPRLGLGALIVFGLALNSVARAQADAPARFAVQGALQAQPPAVEGGRFSLRAALEPRLPQATLEGVGFALKAALTPKGGLLCYGPGHIFASGFEASKGP